MHTVSQVGLVRAGMKLAWLSAVLASTCAVSAQDAGPIPPPRPIEDPSRPSDADLARWAPEPMGPLLAPTLPKGRDIYFPMASAEAARQDLPPLVADAVMRVESAYDPAAVGGVGERGLMQVLPSTASMLGFAGTLDELADPATNIRLGVRYLAGAWKLAGGDLCRTLMKYRAGHNEQRMSALSVEYCRRAKLHLAALGSPLAAGPLPPAEFGTAPSAAAATAAGGMVRLTKVAGRWRRVAPGRTARTGRAFWAAHVERVKAIEARLPWKRGGIMAGG